MTIDELIEKVNKAYEDNKKIRKRRVYISYMFEYSDHSTYLSRVFKNKNTLRFEEQVRCYITVAELRFCLDRFKREHPEDNSILLYGYKEAQWLKVVDFEVYGSTAEIIVEDKQI